MAQRMTLLSTRLCQSASTRSGAQSIRCFSGMPQMPVNKRNDNKEERRHIHTTRICKSDATAAPAVETSSPSTLADRFVVTAEVTVSKIFPAGFGWQTSSIIAENQFGFAPDTLNFALTTGVGDAVGVIGGHCLYYGVKKSFVDSSINMKSEFQTGFLLGSAAFCSGTAWQPLVDALQGANLSFGGVFAGTWVGCGMAFYAGLRAGRTILSGYMEHIEEPTYDNSKADASLSCVIGGATGFFVGTDAAYLPNQNFLINIVGIPDGTPDLVGCGIAGSSTALGFMTSQSVFNVIFPTGKCWND
eukprot:CAMPEP_0172368672 /NCGR_PEP_ID=MMETSP1060-20121228/28656_1 /TAXON_ID=37318 /ORGANISM="Pseudo-nitzschia pungens, Strain cf. cingulata" /LENGTH=301 /DNA_ID=CAMNT_0013093343 /DNA_START=114 /DNA_END=1019 /DNA_ORIENTATION=+